MPDTLLVALPARETRFIGEAARYLERPSFLLRTANLLGQPLEVIGRHLPQAWQRMAGSIVDGALNRALDVALRNLPAAVPQGEIDVTSALRGRWRRNLLTGMTGALSGTFGLPALVVELPVTTTLMLRNIATVAALSGEDLNDPSLRLQCLSVFHLGGAAGVETPDLTAMESSYYAARLSLAGVTREATRYVATVTTEQLASDLARGTSPALVRFIAQIAARFRVVVSEKLLAQAAPAIGAVGGGLINAAFNDHFLHVARYHFGLRALERTHGRETIQDAYRTALRTPR